MLRCLRENAGGGDLLCGIGGSGLSKVRNTTDKPDVLRQWAIMFVGFGGRSGARERVGPVAWGSMGLQILQMVLLGVIFCAGGYFLIERLGRGVGGGMSSAGMFFLEGVLGTWLVGGARVLARLIQEKTRPIARGGLVRLLIIGAGEAAESVLREIRRMPEQRYQVVGLIDDVSKARTRILGAAVLGPISSLPRVCQERQVGEILIALPNASNQEMQRIVSMCRATQMAADMRAGGGGEALRFRTIPSLQDILAGKAVANQIRDVSVNDLLGRDAVETDLGGGGGDDSWAGGDGERRGGEHWERALPDDLPV